MEQSDQASTSFGKQVDLLVLDSAWWNSQLVHVEKHRLEQSGYYPRIVVSPFPSSAFAGETIWMMEAALGGKVKPTDTPDKDLGSLLSCGKF